MTKTRTAPAIALGLSAVLMLGVSGCAADQEPPPAPAPPAATVAIDGAAPSGPAASPTTQSQTPTTASSTPTPTATPTPSALPSVSLKAPEVTAAPATSTADPNERRWQGSDDLPDPDSLDRPGTDQIEDAAPSAEGLSPEELVEAAARTMVSWDTTIDTSETSAYIRALPLFVEEYEERFVVPERPVVPEEWWQAHEHQAASVPHVEITDVYDDGDSMTFQVLAHWTWVGDDDWSLRAGPKYMNFIVVPDGEDHIIQTFSENMLQ